MFTNFNIVGMTPADITELNRHFVKEETICVGAAELTFGSNEGRPMVILMSQGEHAVLQVDEPCDLSTFAETYGNPWEDE
ncbi:hypothetical protein [Roseibium alexandrii]|uniref:Uncharacterized protein n=1 Tax=Roseibium alexandrii (strain DSM 17067 / NCIMB 14079 / DFL-11) TaxID=244592 RepID=A0A5E8GWJ5_ROSAD|nr:hypothetical protein [Roseibium alexandrii]EEE43951.2 hypothetical protein SADFL11_1237 [Roseibium alexandrii DFL-11]